MKFCDYETVYQQMKRSKLANQPHMDSWQTFYAYSMAHDDGKSPECSGQAESEARWYASGRPYYNIWPSVLPMFARLNLDLDGGAITLPPRPAILIRLPADQDVFAFEAEGQTRRVKTIMLASVLHVTHHGKDQHEGLAFWADAGETISHPRVGQDFPVLFDQAWRCKPGTTIEREIETLPVHPSAYEGWPIPREIINNIVRLCCTLCLLEDNPDIITPDVLNDDREKWERTKDPKYAAKAVRRRHMTGWDIGRYIEIPPHIRRPHDALYWTGKGRTTPKIIFRKGCYIHKEKMGKVPTGYLDQDLDEGQRR